MATVSFVPAARRRSLRWVRAAFVAALASIALSWPAGVRARTFTHVACVGDSITYGYGASSTNASYPSDLQKMFGSAVMVKNFGHSGATLLSVGDLPYQMQSEYTAATTFVSGAGASAAVAVVIMLGTNDAKPQNWMSGGRAMQMRTDAAALIDHFAQLGTHPTVYLALPPRSYMNSFGIDGTVLHEQIEPLLKDVAASKSVATIDVYTPTSNDMNLFSDGVHPTDTGYTLVAMIIHDGLLKDAGGAGGAAGGGGAGAGGTAGARGGGGRGGGGATGAGGIGAGGAGGPGGRAGGTGGASEIGSGGSGGSGSGGSGSGGSGSGGSGSGGTGTGGAGTGGVATGGSPTGSGGVGTGGMRAGSGGQGMASGGAMASSSGGANASAGTGGSHAGGGETNTTTDGCSCALGGGGHPSWSLALLAMALLLARARRSDAGRARGRVNRM